MNHLINEKMQQFQPYPIEESACPIKLHFNENTEQMPAWLREEVNRALSQAEFNRYPDPWSVKLRTAYSKIIGQPAERIVVYNGLDEALILLMLFLCQKGDRVLIFKPDFGVYAADCALCGIECINLQKPEGYGLTPEFILHAVKEHKPRLLLFSNPCNPVGMGITREQVLQVLKGAPDTLVFVDEAYMEFWDQSVVDCIDQYPNLIVGRTASKVFGLAGVRLGFVLTNEEIADKLMCSKPVFNISTPDQVVGEVILSHPDVMRESARCMVARRDWFAKELAAYPQWKVYESHTNFVLIEGDACAGLFEKLQEYGVLTQRIGPKGLRITVGTDEECKAVLAALEQIFA